ncbi:hypothetical protein T11_15185 [Trichinella zimbabwensis]|uniref:Uncharacterized protein n=1 Tax=Trichinella zimbabwensis TaxID=268475 RepID=A0A0V1GI18_9BILA|nr:hypothetical protein T11_15185 [Trichinella zimbabwensis]
MGIRDSLKCCEFSKNSKKSFFRFFLGLLGFFPGLQGTRDSLKCCVFSKNSKKSFFTFFPGLMGSRYSLKGC